MSVIIQRCCRGQKGGRKGKGGGREYGGKGTEKEIKKGGRREKVERE